MGIITGRAAAFARADLLTIRGMANDRTAGKGGAQSISHPSDDEEDKHKLA